MLGSFKKVEILVYSYTKIINALFKFDLMNNSFQCTKWKPNQLLYKINIV